MDNVELCFVEAEGNAYAVAMNEEDSDGGSGDFPKENMFAHVYELTGSTISSLSSNTASTLSSDNTVSSSSTLSTLEEEGKSQQQSSLREQRKQRRRPISAIRRKFRDHVHKYNNYRSTISDQPVVVEESVEQHVKMNLPAEPSSRLPPLRSRAIKLSQSEHNNRNSDDHSAATPTASVTAVIDGDSPNSAYWIRGISQRLDSDSYLSNGSSAGSNNSIRGIRQPLDTATSFSNDDNSAEASNDSQHSTRRGIQLRLDTTPSFDSQASNDPNNDAILHLRSPIGEEQSQEMISSTHSSTKPNNNSKSTPYGLVMRSSSVRLDEILQLRSPREEEWQSQAEVPPQETKTPASPRHLAMKPPDGLDEISNVRSPREAESQTIVVAAKANKGSTATKYNDHFDEITQLRSPRGGEQSETKVPPQAMRLQHHLDDILQQRSPRAKVRVQTETKMAPQEIPNPPESPRSSHLARRRKARLDEILQRSPRAGAQGESSRGAKPNEPPHASGMRQRIRLRLGAASPTHFEAPSPSGHYQQEKGKGARTTIEAATEREEKKNFPIPAPENNPDSASWSTPRHDEDEQLIQAPPTPCNSLEQNLRRTPAKEGTSSFKAKRDPILSPTLKANEKEHQIDTPQTQCTAPDQNSQKEQSPRLHENRCPHMPPEMQMENIPPATSVAAREQDMESTTPFDESFDGEFPTSSREEKKPLQVAIPPNLSTSPVTNRLKQPMLEGSSMQEPNVRGETANPPVMREYDNQNPPLKIPSPDAVVPENKEKSLACPAVPGELNTMTLFLDDYSSDQYLTLLDCIYTHNNLQKITIFRHKTEEENRNHIRKDEEIQALFQMLRHRSSSLEGLELCNFSAQDVPTMANGFKDSFVNLEHLQLHLESGTIDGDMTTALGTLPSLISLELEVHGSFPVARLFQKPKSLKVLGVISDHYELPGGDVAPIAKALHQKSVSIEVLDLEPVMRPVSFRFLASALKDNRTLETLQFSCECDTIPDGDKTVGVLLSTLAVNNHLRVIWNHQYELITVSQNMKDKVLQVLRKHPTLEEFYVFAEDPEFASRKYQILEAKSGRC